MRLDLTGRLLKLQRMPVHFSALPLASTNAAWATWFPESMIGFDLSKLSKVEDLQLPPPDAYDQVQVWHALEPGSTNEIYLQAAAYRGHPVYFDTIDPVVMKEGILHQYEVSSGLQFGRSMVVILYLVVLAGAIFLAWRNFRLGHSDRRGSFRVAFALFLIGMAGWLFLANHQSVIEEVGLIEIGLAHALLRAGVFWLFYTALEPFVRKMWPQTLISWSRLMDGRWKDPLVGRDVLIGVFLAVAFNCLLQLQVLAPDWLGLVPHPFIFSSVDAVEGAPSLVGYSCVVVVSVLWRSLFVLLFVMCLRLVLRRMAFVWVAYLVILTPALLFYQDLHPVLGWLLVLLSNIAFLMVLTRYGFLSVAVWLLGGELLQSPITLNFSAWYAFHGMIVPVTLALLASAGFYFSQGGKYMASQARRS